MGIEWFLFGLKSELKGDDTGGNTRGAEGRQGGSGGHDEEASGRRDTTSPEGESGTVRPAGIGRVQWFSGC